jgi:YfiH family protein
VKVASLPAVSAPFEWRRHEELTWIEATLSEARAVFSTRLGGVSDGAYAQLNLGILTEDDPANVWQNRRLLAEALDRDPEAVVLGLQVHGSNVQVQRARPSSVSFMTPHTGLARADAQLTHRAEVTPLVLVADCAPLVLSAPRAVGAVHCGWRGTSSGIVTRALESLCDLAETTPAGVSAAVGPAIGPCCYEVGEEVQIAFERRGLGAALDGTKVDLAAAIALELTAAGVDRASIARTGICTSCNPELFFSHRRDRGVTGRQAGLGWLTV